MDHNAKVLQSINNVKLPVGKTIALYQSEKTGKYCQMDISDVHKTMVEEIGNDYMSAGIVTAIVSLATNDDSLSFHWGSADDCIDYLLEMASDHDAEYRQLEKVTEENKQLNNRLALYQKIEETVEEANDRVRTADEKTDNRKWLMNFGWSEQNTGGGCMVMFKDFMCADGKYRMVGVDGETEYGGLYPVSMAEYGSSDTEYDCETPEENELLCQFQRDEIYTAGRYYWNC